MDEGDCACADEGEEGHVGVFLDLFLRGGCCLVFEERRETSVVSMDVLKNKERRKFDRRYCAGMNRRNPGLLGLEDHPFLSAS